MGQKRHYKGNSRSDDKKRRKAAAEAWASTRGDDQRSNNKPYSSTWVLSNQRMEAFYRAQGIFYDDADFESFLCHLREPLPACFRICSDYAFVNELKEQLLSFVGKTLTVDGREIEAVKTLSWYPQQCAYKLGTDRRSIRKLGALAELHQWLIRHTDNGNITRQEAVSMVPPLALNVAPHHKCLDMCAAPGSKTSQLLEIVNRSLSESGEQQGLVVANDADTDRAYMLVHQCKRINSPLLVVTTHKGQLFPTINDCTSTAAATEVVAEAVAAGDSDKKQKPGPFFDRVLCDVPCSGDGTLRKNPSIWTKWNTAMGSTLHPLQVMIAKRGLQLLKPGGLLVYSTCSMSPFEDESVVAELLRSGDGSLELVDPRQFLPEFKCRAGLQDWIVADDFFAIRKEARKRREAKVTDRGSSSSSSGDGNDNGNSGSGGGNCNDDKGGTSTDSVAVNDSAPTNAAGAAADNMQVEVTEDAATTAAATASTTTAEVGEGEGEGGGGGSKEGGMIGEKYEDMDWSHVEDLHLRRCLELGMTVFKDFDSVPANINSKIRRTLFPPSEEEKAWMHLERCMRCLPQDEDTGGFFVATLRKKLSSEMENSNSSSAEPELGMSEAEAAAAEAAAAAVENNDDDDDDAGDGDKQGAAVAVMADKSDEVDSNATADVTVAAPANSSGNSGSSSSSNSTSALAYRKGMVDFHQFDAAAFSKLQQFYGMSAALQPETFFVREDFSLIGRAKNGKGSTAGNAKSVYFVPLSARLLMTGDREQRLKIVTAGVKVFEKKVQRNGDIDYRLLQDGVQFLAPHITQRVVRVTVQDFCNLLGGGLVSYSTLAAATVEKLNGMPNGALICEYRFNPEDVLPHTATVSPAAATTTTTDTVVAADNGEAVSDHVFYAIGWKGFSRTMNVMCGKVEIDHMKHQLDALHVLRPKICAPRGVVSCATDESTAAATATTSAASTAGEEDPAEAKPVVSTTEGDCSEAIENSSSLDVSDEAPTAVEDAVNAAASDVDFTENK